MLKKDLKQALEQTLKENGDMVTENNQLKNQIEELKKKNHAMEIQNNSLRSDLKGQEHKCEEILKSKLSVVDYNKQLIIENKTFQGINGNLVAMNDELLNRADSYKEQIENLEKKLIKESSSVGFWKDKCNEYIAKSNLLYSLVKEIILGK